MALALAPHRTAPQERYYTAVEAPSLEDVHRDRAYFTCGLIDKDHAGGLPLLARIGPQSDLLKTIRATSEPRAASNSVINQRGVWVTRSR